MKGQPVRTIAIINQKGGCGKTTVSINLAAVMAARGRRTLLVDMDPQGHCALGLAVPDSQIQRSIYDMLRTGLDGSQTFGDAVWQITRHLDLAPSTMALAGIEQELAQQPNKDRRLAQVLSTVRDQYDFCIIDCPPSIGLLTFNALRAADEVIIPVETGYFALQGSFKQEATIEMLAQRVGHRARIKVLATMYDMRTKIAREILCELRRHFADKLLPVVVHFNSKLKESSSFGQPITEYDTASRGMQDFEKLAAWLVTNPPIAEPAAAAVQQAVDPNTPMNRAAELVERARALSERTATLADKIQQDPDVSRAMHELGETKPQEVAEEGPAKKHAATLARFFGVRPTAQGLLFVQPVNGATTVHIAGDFNRWKPQQTPLHRDEKLGVFQTCVAVSPGRYRYRLVVDGTWLEDPYNKCVESNPFGELNSIVEVKTRA